MHINGKVNNSWIGDTVIHNRFLLSWLDYCLAVGASFDLTLETTSTREDIAADFCGRLVGFYTVFCDHPNDLSCN